MKRNFILTGCALMSGALPVFAQVVNEDYNLVASDASAGDGLGGSVALSGNLAVAGSPGDDGFAGSAYIFDTSTGQQLFKLTASDAAAGDALGTSVAISGTTAIVGAPRDDDGGNRSGAAYIFDASTGQQIFKLTASDSGAFDEFGSSVSISGTTAIISSPGDSNSAGSAYIFDTTTGQQLLKLTASDGEMGDVFGGSVAISGSTAIISAFNDRFSLFRFGSAYIFDTTTGQQLFKLNSSDGDPDEAFGAAVAISGSRAIVGSVNDDGFSGSAYVFNTITGEELLKITGPNAVAPDKFGQSVAISGNTAIVGAEYDIVDGQVPGAAYAFDISTGDRLRKFTASDGVSLDGFGQSVAISGNTAIVGAYQNDDSGADSGSAYVFIQPPEITMQPQSVIVSPGEVAVFSVVVTNPGAREFQWRRDGVELSNGGNISGARSSTLQVLAEPSDEAFYDCVISDPVSIVSSAVVLGVRPDPDPCVVDLNNDGNLNFFDVSEFLMRFGMGCP